MHSSPVLTTDGTPLGLAAAQFWSRKGFKGTNARKRRINATTVPTEEKESDRRPTNVTRSARALGDPDRCVHIGDRGGDLFELFHAAHAARTHVLVRTAVGRLAGRGRTTVAKGMRRQPVRGLHRVEVRDDHGNVSTGTVRVRFCRLTIHPSPGKRKRYGPLSLTVIHAIERGCPADRAPIRWKLLTDRPVDDLAAAVEKLNGSAVRWKIESFHKAWKTGTGVESLQLTTRPRLEPAVGLSAVVAVFLLGLRDAGREPTAAQRPATDWGPAVGPRF